MAGPNDWLFAIDLQPGFADPRSPWGTPGLAPVLDRVEALLPAFGDRTLFSRWIPMPEIRGSWRPYYDRWKFAQEPDNDWMWELEPRFAGRPSVASHTFSKWLPEAVRHFPEGAEIVICGVATECCVLATVLDAVDAGVPVRLVADACATKDAAIHSAALAIMAGRAPMLTMTTTAEELARRAA